MPVDHIGRSAPPHGGGAVEVSKTTRSMKLAQASTAASESGATWRIPMPDNNPIRYDAKDGIATVTIDRPERKNALSWQAMEGLTDAWERAEGDASVRVVILTSADCGVFCAGMDLKQAAEIKAREGVDLTTKARDPMQGNMRSVTKPIIAAMTGSLMAGGMMLSLNCDL